MTGVVTGSVAQLWGLRVCPRGRAVGSGSVCSCHVLAGIGLTLTCYHPPRPGPLAGLLGLVAGVAGGLPGPGDGVQDVLGWDTLQPRQPQPCTGSVPLPDPPMNMN